VGVGRTHAPLGGTDLVLAALLLLKPVEDRVVGHDDVAAGREPQVAGVDAALVQALDFLEQQSGVEDDAGADDAEAVGPEDAGWDEVELEGALIGDHGVAGVRPAVGPDYEIGALGHNIDQLALALVAPLATEDDRYRHDAASSLRRMLRSCQPVGSRPTGDSSTQEPAGRLGGRPGAGRAAATDRR